MCASMIMCVRAGRSEGMVTTMAMMMRVGVMRVVKIGLMTVMFVITVMR